jgi:hypothetical protein
VLQGVVERNGVELIHITTGNKLDLDEFVPLTRATDIQPIDKASNGDGNFRARNVDPPPLVESLLGRSESCLYSTTTRHDCTIVASGGAVDDDLADEAFVANVGERIGCLQELARVRELPGASLGWRTVKFAAGGNAEGAEDRSSRFTIFDGARGYERHSHRFRSSHHLVVLDKGRPDSAAGAELLNLEYVERSRDVDLGVGVRPEGVEIIAFEVSVA